MPRPYAALSFEGTSVDLTEGQLLRVGKLLLKDEGIATSMVEFNALYLPLMQVVTAMNEWREPPPPEPEFIIRKRVPIVTSENEKYFLNNPAFDRTVLQPDGSTLKTRPVLIDTKVDLLALVHTASDDFTDTLSAIKVTRVYLQTGDEWEVVDVSNHEQASFIKRPHAPRNLMLTLKVGEFFALYGGGNVELGTLEIVSESGADLKPFAVDLEVETINYNQRAAI